jgi:hypothetical protein
MPPPLLLLMLLQPLPLQEIFWMELVPTLQFWILRLNLQWDPRVRHQTRPLYSFSF